MSIHDAEYDIEYAQMYEKSSKNKVDIGYQDLDYLNRHANNELIKLLPIY